VPGERPVSAFTHRNADGTAKARLTRSVAKARCAGDPKLNAYFCPTCRGWHIGHRNGRRREQTEWSRTWDRIRIELEIAS
jgi:hypothetical protein